jgi:hypothetical protein
VELHDHHLLAESIVRMIYDRLPAILPPSA